MTNKYVVTRGANATRKVYHTNTECPRLTKSTTRQTTEQEITHYDLDKCTFCSGESNAGNHNQEQTDWHKINKQLRDGEINL